MDFKIRVHDLIEQSVDFSGMLRVKDQIVGGEMKLLQQLIAVFTGKDKPRIAAGIGGVGGKVVDVVLVIKNDVSGIDRLVSYPSLSAHDVVKAVAGGDSIDKGIGGMAVVDAKALGVRREKALVGGLRTDVNVIFKIRVAELQQ